MPTATAEPTAGPARGPLPALPTATPGAPSVAPAGSNLIIDAGALATRPTSGSAWGAMKAVADAPWDAPNLCDQNNKVDAKALAAALVYARTGATSYRDRTVAAIRASIPTQVHGCPNAVLALGRQLGGYVMAADLVGYRDPSFLAWLDQIRTTNLGGQASWYILRNTARDSANNWGTFALASLIAADRFLADTTSLADDWAIFAGYGQPFGYAFHKTLSWQAAWSCVATDPADPTLLPIAINPTGCTLGAYDVDGAPVEDASRTGYPTVGNYPAESAQGYVVQALLLARAGYPAWTVNDSQVRRVALWRERFGNLNYSSVDDHVTWMTNRIYGLSQPTKPAGYGRLFGYTDWLFG